MRGELLWIRWVSGSTLLQGTSVMMSVFIFNGASGRENHKHHEQGDMSLKTTSILARNSEATSQGHIFLYKVKSHAGTAGNERADKFAKYQTSLEINNVNDGKVPSAGPGDSPLYIAWLAWEEAGPSTS
eukprot:1151388-Pelagomonas_calceolata.AAC.1